MKLYNLTLLLLVSCFLFSCGNDATEDETNNPKVDSLNVKTTVVSGEVKIIEPIKDEKIVVLESNGITLTEVKSKKTLEAAIKLNTKQFSEGKNHLSFSVTGVQNYTVSYLANNYALTQFSSDIIDVEFLYGNNVFLAFLTDKNNIGIKTNKGSVLKNAVLGADAESLFDMNHPHLFYHLPQADTHEAILDFYLVNTSVSKNGNKVKVMINDTEFILNKWAAYKISGLKDIENTVRIQLIDEKGNLIEGPFNDSGDRKFNFVNTKTHFKERQSIGRKFVQIFHLQFCIFFH